MKFSKSWVFAMGIVGILTSGATHAEIKLFKNKDTNFERKYFDSPGRTQLAVTRFCSDRLSRDYTSFKEALASKKSTINLLVNKKTCTKDKAVIEKLVLQKTISIANLKSICPKRIKVGRNNVGIKIDDHAMQSPAGTLRVLWADNLENDLKPKKLCGDNNCTVSVSPLVIHVASNVKQPEPVELSAQEQGVMFDLFGKKGDGRKVRISWFTNHEYRMLALPNERGEVLSIDQLFGSNTYGPDDRYAVNGYAALAKYDGTSADGKQRLSPANGRIDKNDAIFSQLRLWHDKDFDGIAQPDELTPLSAEKIEYIDLNFKNRQVFSNTDENGNRTEMLSYVGYEDGKRDVMFDIWFNARALP